MCDDSARVKKPAMQKERQRPPSELRVCFVARVLPWDFLSKRKANKTQKTKLQSEAGKQTHKCAHCFQSKVVEVKHIGIIENRLEAALRGSGVLGLDKPCWAEGHLLIPSKTIQFPPNKPLSYTAQIVWFQGLKGAISLFSVNPVVSSLKDICLKQSVI